MITIIIMGIKMGSNSMKGEKICTNPKNDFGKPELLIDKISTVSAKNNYF